MIVWRIAALLLIAMSGGLAVAQEVDTTPGVGVLNLSVRFMPDPVSVAVEASGAIETGNAAECDAVASAPSLTIVYQAGDFPLLISVVSEAGVVLLVRDPEGNWVCNRDLGGPRADFFEPVSGRYDIWVKTTDGSIAPAVLEVSEISARTAAESPKISWFETAVHLRIDPAASFEFTCPPIRDPSHFLVWGTDIYTDHSSICAAAAHAGAITLAGGVVAILELDGLDGLHAYAGTTRNGITSLDSADWFFSFGFVYPTN